MCYHDNRVVPMVPATVGVKLVSLLKVPMIFWPSNWISRETTWERKQEVSFARNDSFTPVLAGKACLYLRLLDFDGAQQANGKTGNLGVPVPGKEERHMSPA